MSGHFPAQLYETLVVHGPLGRVRHTRTDTVLHPSRPVIMIDTGISATFQMLATSSRSRARMIEAVPLKQFTRIGIAPLRSDHGCMNRPAVDVERRKRVDPALVASSAATCLGRKPLIVACTGCPFPTHFGRRMKGVRAGRIAGSRLRIHVRNDGAGRLFSRNQPSTQQPRSRSVASGSDNREKGRPRSSNPATFERPERPACWKRFKFRFGISSFDIPGTPEVRPSTYREHGIDLSGTPAPSLRERSTDISGTLPSRDSWKQAGCTFDAGP